MGKSTLQTGATNSRGERLLPAETALGRVPGESGRRWKKKKNDGTDPDSGLAGFTADGLEIAGAVTETGREELTRVIIRSGEIFSKWLNGGRETKYSGEARPEYAAEKAERDALEARMRELDADWAQGLDLLAKYKEVSKQAQTPEVADRKAKLHAALMATEAARSKAFNKGSEPPATPTADYSHLISDMGAALDWAAVQQQRREERRLRLEALHGGEANLGRAVDACENVAANLNEIRGANIHNPGIRRLAALGKALAAGELTTEDDFVSLGDIQEEIASTITDLQDEWAEAGEAQALDTAVTVIGYQVEARCLELNF